jgi:hypothetical protein
MDQSNSHRTVIHATLIGFAVFVLATGAAMAYEWYDDADTADDCSSCHGDFRDPYTSLKPGEGSWGDDLHDIHRYDMLAGDCDACHGGLGGSRKPVSTYTSDGGLGLPAIGCVGCHGRDDGTGTVTGTGLRQHHYRAGTTGCVDCHTDSNPANATPVGEDVLPPYYFNDPNHTAPTDPCNLPTAYNEGFYAATTLGLDNDGDGVYDENDSDCGAATAPPGETSGSTLNPLLVTAHDSGAGSMTLSFETACLTTDNTIEYGPLASVASYGYSGQECNIGTSGTYAWAYPAGDLFFLVVGNDGVAEGSYGLDSTPGERPEDSTVMTCSIPQILTDRCD